MKLQTRIVRYNWLAKRKRRSKLRRINQQRILFLLQHCQTSKGSIAWTITKPQFNLLQVIVVITLNRLILKVNISHMVLFQVVETHVMSAKTMLLHNQMPNLMQITTCMSLITTKRKKSLMNKNKKMRLKHKKKL